MWLLSDDIAYYVAPATNDLLLIVGRATCFLVERSQLWADVQRIGRCKALECTFGIRAHSTLHAVSWRMR